MNSTKCVWRPASARTRWGDSLAVIRGGREQGMERKGLEIGAREGRKGTEGIDAKRERKGRQGEGRESSTWIFVQESRILEDGSVAEWLACWTQAQ